MNLKGAALINADQDLQRGMTSVSSSVADHLYRHLARGSQALAGKISDSLIGDSVA